MGIGLRAIVGLCCFLFSSCNTFDTPSNGDTVGFPDDDFTSPGFPPGIAGSRPVGPFFAGTGSLAGSAGAPFSAGNTAAPSGGRGGGGWQPIDAGVTPPIDAGASSADDAGADDAGH